LDMLVRRVFERSGAPRGRFLGQHQIMIGAVSRPALLHV